NLVPPTVSGPAREQSPLPTLALLVSAPTDSSQTPNNTGDREPAAEGASGTVVALTRQAPAATSGGGEDDEPEPGAPARDGVAAAAEGNRQDFVIGLDDALRQNDAALRKQIIPSGQPVPSREGGPVPDQAPAEPDQSPPGPEMSMSLGTPHREG